MEQREAIDRLVGEGLTVIRGPAKSGKSWIALQLAAAVATGEPALEEFATIQGDVVFFAAINSSRRMQRRVRSVCGSLPPDSLRVFFNNQVTYSFLDWLMWSEGSRRRLVVIDAPPPDARWLNRFRRFVESTRICAILVEDNALPIELECAQLRLGKVCAGKDDWGAYLVRNNASTFLLRFDISRRGWFVADRPSGAG